MAVLPRPENLHAALQELERRIDEATLDEYSAKLQSIDVLAIPNTSFNLSHEFAELQGIDKTIENTVRFQGVNIAAARQSILFRLDRSGATVVSESNAVALAVPRQFVVDRPFLIVMKRRSSSDPYLVVWIENAELLEPAIPVSITSTHEMPIPPIPSDVTTANVSRKRNGCR